MTDLVNFRGQIPYDWKRATKTMLDLADELGRSGFHHLPDFAEAMRLALAEAHRHADGNWGGRALKALGAFWDIFEGRLDDHPEYAERDMVVAAGRKAALEQVKEYLQATGLGHEEYSVTYGGEKIVVILPETHLSPDYAARMAATVATLFSRARSMSEDVALAQIKRAARL